MTGYELKKFFDASVAHFWNAELSQIYPTLKQLESEGLVDMNVDVQDDRPNRKVYSLTDDGRNELLSWLGSPAEPEQVREPILVKVFFAAVVSKEEIVRVLERRIADLHQSIAYLKGSLAFVGHFASTMGLPSDGFFWSLTPELGIKINEAQLEWAREAIEKIKAVDFPSDRPRSEMNAQVAVQMLERVRLALEGAH